MTRTIIRTESLGKEYRRGLANSSALLRDTLARVVRSPTSLFRRKRDTKFWALRDVSIEVREGEVLGLIGRNGSGKTTLLKILSRITRPTTGWAEIQGRVGSLLEVGTGFHPELTGRENVFLNGAILGMGHREVSSKFDEIVSFAELEEFIDTPVKHYSSGMYVRLAFAVAAHLEPEILLVDEVLAVGDLRFQRKCLGKMGDVAHAGRTIILVSHQLNQIRRLCERVVWLDAGSLRKSGPTSEVVAAYESEMTSSDSVRDHSVSGPAQFLRWQLNHTETTVPHLLTSDGVTTISFVVRVHKPLHHLHHGIALYDSSRHLIWANSVDGVTLAPGEHEIRHRILTLPIRPGSYFWRVSLHDGAERIDDWEALPPMQVATIPLTHKNDEWAGFLNIESNCSIEPVLPNHE